MENGTAVGKRRKWSKIVIKGSLVILVIVLVLRYQVNRPKTPHFYYTDKSYDSTRDGTNFTCGCNVPTFMQGPQNPTSGSGPGSHPNSSHNVCHGRSATETVSVLMYSNFTQVGWLERVLESAYGTEYTTRKKETIVEGSHGSKQAHDISWNNDTFLENLSVIYPARTATQRQLKISIDYLQNKPNNAPFVDFPSSYINLALAFNCTNCSKCPLHAVNQIFTDISGHSSQTWGDCSYWSAGNHCRNATEKWYVAKCVMYSTEAMPLNFAVTTFLRTLTNMLSPSGYIWAPEDFNAMNYTSLGANVLYMDFSKTARGPIQLNFFEIQKYSAAWLDILGAFPSLGSECAMLKDVEVSNGTSICNVFSDTKKRNLEVKCIKMRNTSECEQYVYKNDPLVNVTVDADENLWGEFNVSKGRWTNIMCLDYETQSIPPYTVLWETSPAMKSSSLNQFLELKKLSELWARNSGVCINTYKNILRRSIREGNNIVNVFMESNCTYHAGDYCWLTGRYHHLTDSPGQPWHEMPSFSNPPNLFVCYAVKDQNFWIWLLVTFGLLFGWLGTIDLTCNWIVFPLAEWIWRNFKTLRNGAEVSRIGDEGAQHPPSVPRARKVLGEVVIVKHEYSKLWSDTAAVLGRRRPVTELEVWSPLTQTTESVGTR